MKTRREEITQLVLKHSDCRLYAVSSGTIPEGYTEPSECADQILSLFKELELPLLSEEEKFICSAVSKYPYKDVKDVIDESIKHERDLIKNYLEKI